MRLSGSEIAARLSFVVWNALPDSELNEAAKSVWVVELPQKPLVFGREAQRRYGHLTYQSLEVGENRSIDLDPLARDLKERAGKQVIENVVAAVRHRESMA